jgi:ApbE superfamily uncharacterized protein (UPF0280 family)
MHQPRIYRHWVKDKDLTHFNLVVKETDLYIRATTNLEQEAIKLVTKYRQMLEGYIERHPSFLTSLEPIAIENNAPPIIRQMAEAAERAGVGPMAAVAGAIAESVGNELLPLSPEVIVENGGDIYLKSLKKRLIGIYAGQSPLSGKVALEIKGEETPMGICTSSGTVGHSLSFGKADAVIVLSPSATLADAAATAIGNLVIQAGDIPLGMEFAQGIDGVRGVIIVKGDKMGLWGEVKIHSTSVEKGNRV